MEVPARPTQPCRVEGHGEYHIDASEKAKGFWGNFVKDLIFDLISFLYIFNTFLLNLFKSFLYPRFILSKNAPHVNNYPAGYFIANLDLLIASFIVFHEPGKNLLPAGVLYVSGFMETNLREKRQGRTTRTVLRENLRGIVRKCKVMMYRRVPQPEGRGLFEQGTLSPCI